MTSSPYRAARGSARADTFASSRASRLQVSGLRATRSGNAAFDALMPARSDTRHATGEIFAPILGGEDEFDGYDAFEADELRASRTRISEVRGSKSSASHISFGSTGSRAGRDSIDFDGDFDYMDEIGGRKSTESTDEGKGAQRSRSGFLAAAGAAISSRRRASRKAKADKEFSRQFADASPARSDEGPRAALYTGELGAEQRRAVRHSVSFSEEGLSAKSASKADNASGFAARLPKSRRSIVALTVAVCLVLTCVTLYTPLQRYYLASRDYDQAAAELEAITERNSELEERVDFLNTKQGAEQSARDQFGWIMPDENAVIVQGLGSGVGTGNELDIVGNIAPGSVPAPEKWYTPLLDAVFGVDDTALGAASPMGEADSEGSGETADGSGDTGESA